MPKKIILLLKSGIKFENMLKDYLSQEGFEVDTAETVAEVLYYLKRSPHFLLVVEQDTYEMDCLELFLNARDIQSNIKVVFLGSGDPKSKDEIMKLGGIYLDSPVRAEVFREIINDVRKVR